MRRDLALTSVFALAVVAVVALSSVFTYRRVRGALETELARRVEWVAAAGAADVSARQVRLLSLLGRDAFATSDSLLLALAAVRRSSQAARVYLFDARGTVLLDSQNDSLVGRPAHAFASERTAVARTLAGQSAHTALHEEGGRRYLTGFAPVREALRPGEAPGGGRAIAVLAVETSAEFLDVLPQIARLLATAASLAALAVLILAALFFRLSVAQRHLERSLSRAENLASIGELAATLAHEVRNPLGVIQGAAARLERHYRGPESELFEYIRSEVERLARTVQRYLDFARPSPPGEGGDVRSVVAATLGLLAREAEGRGVRLVAEGEAAGTLELGGNAACAPVALRMGGEELKQALLNLIRNALEALPGGGEVRVGWAARRRDVEIWIADDGPGMDATTLARVRRPFFTTRAQGTGLGLAIVERLARDAGGRLEIESGIGRGTVCKLRLPRVDSRTAPSREDS